MYDIREVPKAKCTICGTTKECIRFEYADKALLIFPTQDVLYICETCLSRAFSLLRKDR